MLGKTWLENHLHLMLGGTRLDQGGKPAKKAFMNLRQFGLDRVACLHGTCGRALGGRLGRT